MKFDLTSGGFGLGSHTVGRFRISVTTDDRTTFADGLANGGDVEANWIVLDPDTFFSDNGGVVGNDTTLAELPDHSLLASGSQAVTAVETYTVTALTDLTGITGVRLEMLTDPSLPLNAGGFNGPGRSTTSGNYVLREFAMTRRGDRSDDCRMPRILVPDASDAGLGTAWTEPAFARRRLAERVAGHRLFGRQPACHHHRVRQPRRRRLAHRSSPGSLGHDFDVHRPITVTALGVFDSGADGLARDLTAQIWTRAGSLLASLTFTAADPGTLVGSDRFKPFPRRWSCRPAITRSSPTAMAPASRTATREPADRSPAHKTLDDGGGLISFVGSSRAGDAGTFPAWTDGGPVNRYGAGTFQFTAPPYAGLIATDLESRMLGQTASALARLEFEVEDPAVFDWLLLRMKYNDGFVAYLNGVEVVRRNAPDLLDWNSTATAERPLAESLVFENIGLNDYLDEMVPGVNVLAVHGLNVNAADGDFLIYPELLAGTVLDTQARYLDPPTPGEPNDAPAAFLGFVADTTFSVDRGFYRAADLQPGGLLEQGVAIATETPGATIRYTTDGSARPKSTAKSTPAEGRRR